MWSSYNMEMHMPHGRVCRYLYVVFSDNILSLDIVNNISRSIYSYHSITLSLNIVNHISRSNYSYQSIILSLNIVNHRSRSNYFYLLWQIVRYHGILVGMKHLYWNALSVVVAYITYCTYAPFTPENVDYWKLRLNNTLQPSSITMTS